MIQQYTITGMTCNGCVNSVQGKLLALDGVEEVSVDLATGQATLTQQQVLPITTLANALGSKYTITTDKNSVAPVPVVEETTDDGFS